MHPFLRCELSDANAAREINHAFFAEVVGAVKHFAARQLESSARTKRGSGLKAVSLDHDEVAEVAHARQNTPDVEFDRQSAITVLARGLEAPRLECIAENRESFFDLVKPKLKGDGVYGNSAALAEVCDMSLDAFRMAVHRLKKRLRQNGRRKLPAP